jgi:hypothetical protein
MLASTVAPDLPTLPAAPQGVARGEASGPSLWRRLAGTFGWRVRAGSGEPDPRQLNGALIACLSDLPPIDTRALRHLLAHARSASELWHLRPEVYRVLSLHHSQAEAERRLAALGPLFERRRAPRQRPPR